MGKPHILILNGPNLNLLGRRQPEIYGTRTFDSFYEELKETYHHIMLAYYQSNHEGAIIDKLHDTGFTLDGIILNAAGYTHTSIAIADAVAAIASPVVELHISDIYQREDFRKTSYLQAHCIHHIIGRGLNGYAEAIDYLLAYNT